VDFGSREIRVLIARQAPGGGLSVLGHGEAPAQGCVSQGVIQDRNAAQIALKRALSSAEKMANVKLHSIFCGINGKNVETFVREGKVDIKLGSVELEQMSEARSAASRDVETPGRSITSSITAQEWYVDDLRVLNPAGIRGEALKTRIHFARIPEAIEDNIAACVESQRLEIEDMIFLPLAASLGCLTPEDKELGVAVVDIGHSTTGLAVYRDFRIMGSGVFEWGGYHITRDVAAGLQVSFGEADELVLECGISEDLLKEEYGEGSQAGEQPTPADVARIKLKTAVSGANAVVSRRDLEEIIFDRANELMVKVRQHLHSRGLAKHLVRGVVLTGGASSIRNHVRLAEAVFQAPCRIGTPLCEEPLPHALQAPEFAGLLGIARHGFQYRAAARNGGVEGGSARSWLRRTGRFLRRYFI
jgi:cell division protein FtsA